MRVLIIHHLEPMWENGYKMFGTSFDRLQEKFLDHLNEKSYDKVILTRFEDHRLGENYCPDFAKKVSQVHTYDYGWTREMFSGAEEFCEGGTHSEVVWIADWMKSLAHHDVTISGAFDGECIEDLEIALNFLNVNYKRENSLIV